LKENDHSKVYIFDEDTPESIALIGGMNIGDEYLTAVNHQHPEQGGWHDYMVRIKGEGAKNLLPPLTIPQKKYWFRKKIMNGIEILFNWKGKRKMKRELIKELQQAKKSILIEHGYITDDSITRKLRHMAKKNIAVTIILPDRSDGVYNANMHTIHKLLKPTALGQKHISHIRIFLYRGMIHAKVIVIDDTTTIMGSANLTSNSFHFLNETNAIFRSKTGITKEVLRQIKKDLWYCTPITFQTIPPYNRWKAAIERIFI
jgi:cardiolipin synthase